MREEKYSGQVWAMKFRIPILDPKGWSSIDDYNHSLISKEEFCNRAANSEIKKSFNVSRRSAARFVKKI